MLLAPEFIKKNTSFRHSQFPVFQQFGLPEPIVRSIQSNRQTTSFIIHKSSIFVKLPFKCGCFLISHRLRSQEKEKDNRYFFLRIDANSATNRHKYLLSASLVTSALTGRLKLYAML